jgi:hypothetical protein
MLRGTIRDRAGGRRRAFVRLYGCVEDLSDDAPDAPDTPDAPLPDRVASGAEPLLIVGAMAGGRSRVRRRVITGAPAGDHGCASSRYSAGNWASACWTWVLDTDRRRVVRTARVPRLASASLSPVRSLT